MVYVAALARRVFAGRAKRSGAEIERPRIPCHSHSMENLNASAAKRSPGDDKEFIGVMDTS